MWEFETRIEMYEMVRSPRLEHDCIQLQKCLTQLMACW